LGRRGGTGQRRRKIILYSVPFIALSLFLVVYYVATASPPAAEDFSIPIAIQLEQMYGGSPYISPVLPVNVGIRGGIWATHQYDSYGINGHYPVFAQEAPGGNLSYALIHVKSTVVRTYTLQDFFNVWGQQLSQNDTLGYVVPVPQSQTGTYASDSFWELCIQPPGGGAIVQGNWTYQPLTPGEGIVLKYSDSGCRPCHITDCPP
jgi:hypothetical protein